PVSHVFTLRPSLYQSSSLFFYGYGAHAVLPSFPTRRSSDLIMSRKKNIDGKEKNNKRNDPNERVQHDIIRFHLFHTSSLPVKRRDRKSTRLNSSHVSISYAVFCLKKKTNAAVTSPEHLIVAD